LWISAVGKIVAGGQTARCGGGVSSRRAGVCDRPRCRVKGGLRPSLRDALTGTLDPAPRPSGVLRYGMKARPWMVPVAVVVEPNGE
jgi:hypothetical protein